MKRKKSIPRLHYEAPGIELIQFDASCPLMQSLTIPDVVEEELDW
jgi:hypothetical protein